MRKRIIVLMLFILPTIFFAKEYVSENIEMLSLKNESIGLLYKGTEVKSTENKYTLSGWVMDGNEYIIFYSDKARIKLARIDENFIKNMKVYKIQEDEYGVKWKKVDMNFKLKSPKSLVNNENELWKNEAELYQRCGSCHKTFDFHEYTPNQWPSIIKTMKNNAGYSKKESKEVSVYLQYQSLKGKLK
ncbi:MAG: hypothetical protein WBF48_11320 [Halarcobacter sp.]